MTIGREVYDDLLTLAEAGMASPATQKLLEECRVRHPEWAAMPAIAAELPRLEAPAGLEREALTRTQRLLSQRSWLMFAGIALCMSPMTMGFTDRIRFLLYRDQPVLAGVLYGLGLLVWAAFVWTNRRLATAGLAPATGRGVQWGWILGALGVFAPAMIMISSWTAWRFTWAWMGVIAFAALAAGVWAAGVTRRRG